MREYEATKKLLVKYLDEVTHARIKEALRFDYPTDTQIREFRGIEKVAFDLLVLVGQNIPESREKNNAITKIEEGILWAKRGIEKNIK